MSMDVDVLVEHERQRRAAADRQALLVARAGLLDVHVEVTNGVDDARGVVHEPARVGVGDEHVARLEHRTHLRGYARCLRPRGRRPSAGIACSRRAVGRRRSPPFRRAALRDRAIQRHGLAEAPAKQLTHRQSRGLAQDVPAGDVDRRLHVSVALEQRSPCAGSARRAALDRRRPAAARAPQDPRARPPRRPADRPGPSGQHSPWPANARVGLDAHDRAVEQRHGFAAPTSGTRPPTAADRPDRP